MVAVESEYIVGTYLDDTFGPVLAFGQGGSRVEQISKPQLRLLPLTRTDCADVVGKALAELGELPAESAVSALIDAVAAVGRFAVAAGERLVELDVNPLVLSADGRVLAIDAVAHFKESE